MFCVFTGRVRQLATSGGPILLCTFFTNLSTKPTTSGGPIFRCTTKDRGERRAKGLRPLESPGVNSDSKPDVLCAYLLAKVRLTRLSRLRRSAYPLASACCTAVELMALSQPPNFRPQIRLVILSVPTFSPHYEQYNRVRGNSAKHATDGPKSR